MQQTTSIKTKPHEDQQVQTMYIVTWKSLYD